MYGHGQLRTLWCKREATIHGRRILPPIITEHGDVENWAASGMQEEIVMTHDITSAFYGEWVVSKVGDSSDVDTQQV